MICFQLLMSTNVDDERTRAKQKEQLARFLHEREINRGERASERNTNNKKSNDSTGRLQVVKRRIIYGTVHDSHYHFKNLSRNHISQVCHI